MESSGEAMIIVEGEREGEIAGGDEKRGRPFVLLFEQAPRVVEGGGERRRLAI